MKWYFAEEQLLLAYDFPCNYGAGSGRMHIGSSLCLHWLHTQRSAMPRKASSGAYVSGRARSREACHGKVARSTNRLLCRDWCVRTRQDEPVLPSARPTRPNAARSSARGERLGRALLSVTGQHAAYMEPLKRARFAVAREHRCAVVRPAAIAVPARGSNHQLMRWDGAVEVPPVL